jgi:hypothetical protein
VAKEITRALYWFALVPKPTKFHDGDKKDPLKMTVHIENSVMEEEH